MNAVDIEEAITASAGQSFDPAEFPFAFLHLCGKQEVVKKGTSV